MCRVRYRSGLFPRYRVLCPLFVLDSAMCMSLLELDVIGTGSKHKEITVHLHVGLGTEPKVHLGSSTWLFELFELCG